jgi:hypothetical protein
MVPYLSAFAEGKVGTVRLIQTAIGFVQSPGNLRARAPPAARLELLACGSHDVMYKQIQLTVWMAFSF